MSIIAVDVTPLLPGGTNGGAKPMVLALLQELPRLMPAAHFVLLTADYSHDELAFLDAPNVERKCVLMTQPADEARRPSVNQRIRWMARQKIFSRLPLRIKRPLQQLYYRLRLIRVSTTAPSLLKELGADLLFCTIGTPTYYDPSVPTLSVVYDLQFQDYPQFFEPEDLMLRQLHYQQTCNLSDHIVTISEFTRQSVLQSSSFQPDQVTTIHISLVHEFETASTQEVQAFLQRFGLQEKGYLFYPANFWEHKNHRRLLESFEQFHHGQQHSPLKLVMTGALDERRQSLQLQCQAAGLDKKVVLLGYLPEHELGILFQNAKALVFPSLYEGFGIPLLEAMQAGVPVACSNATSLPEVGGDSVLYFTPTDTQEILQAIETLDQDENIRTMLIEKGMARYKVFGAPREMARKYQSVIEQILQSHREIRHYGLRGLTEDAWFQETAYLLMPQTKMERVLRVTLHVPDWMPTTLEIHVLGKELSENRLVFPCRETSSQDIHLPSSDGVIELRFSRAYTPASLGLGEDTRLLSARCLAFCIFEGDQKVFDALTFQPRKWLE